ncbi:MAG: DUF47 family protein [Methanomicrobiaceae archaeon]|nr:DUF47 family protein [Methanomicrobiaceae archaeon]
MGLKEWVVPQDKIFFDNFEKMAGVLLEAADCLVNLVEDFSDVKNKCHKLKQLEHAGDIITHEVYEHLNRTFITPLEPEEISRLASALDDILDYIDGTAQQMNLYNIPDTDDHMIEFAKVIQLSVLEIDGAVRSIRGMKSPKSVEDRCIEINRLENLADDILAHSIRELFENDDAVTIIKFKDIYENLELATDKCEDAANVLSDIAIRHT